jgi:hypothetical protein
MGHWGHYPMICRKFLYRHGSLLAVFTAINMQKECRFEAF